MNLAEAVATRRGQDDGTAIADVTGAVAWNILTAALLKLCGLTRTPQKSNFKTRHNTVWVSQNSAGNGVTGISGGCWMAVSSVISESCKTYKKNSGERNCLEPEFRKRFWMRNPRFWLQKIITDPQILAHVNKQRVWVTGMRNYKFISQK